MRATFLSVADELLSTGAPAFIAVIESFGRRSPSYSFKTYAVSEMSWRSAAQANQLT
jgi:hypothetical protein